MLSFGRPASRDSTDAVGEHRFDPGELGAHAPVAQDPLPPALVAISPPTVARVAGGEVDAEVEPRGPGVRLQVGEPHAGAGGHLSRPPGPPARVR